MFKLRQMTMFIVAILVMSTVLPQAAFASYAYDYGRTSDLNYADDGVRERVFSKKFQGIVRFGK